MVRKSKAGMVLAGAVTGSLDMPSGGSTSRIVIKPDKDKDGKYPDQTKMKAGTLKLLDNDIVPMGSGKPKKQLNPKMKLYIETLAKARKDPKNASVPYRTLQKLVAEKLKK